MPLPTKANTTRPAAHGYDALIEYGEQDAESLYLRLAVGPGRSMRLQTVEPAEQGPSTRANPEDMRAESGTSFSRARFSGGEGLDQAHRPDGSDRDPARYWDSRNIDITPTRAGELEKIQLLPSASTLRALDVSNTRNPLVRVGTVLYGVINDDAQVDRTADPTAAIPTWSQENPGGTGDVEDLAALGNELYAAQNTIRLRSAAGSWSSWSDLNASRVWAAKGRIIAADQTGDELYEARASAGSVLLHTLPAGETWTDVVDAGAAILASATDGYIYAFTEENGELTLRRRTELDGEIPQALAFAQGLVFIGTSEATTGGGQIGRLWRAALVGLQIRNGQVLRTWGTGATTVDRSPKRIIATREAVWTGIVEDGTETHIWRYHLETGGMSRDLIMADSGVVQGLAVFDDRLFATVNDADLYRQDTTYADEGWLIGPLGDLYNAAKKIWVGARLSTSAVPTDTQAVLSYSTDPAALSDPDHASWVEVITATAASPGDSAETAITAVESRYIVGKLTLTPNGANTATPEVLAYAFRGLAGATENDFQIPVNVSDRIEAPNKKPQTYPGVGDAVYEKLKDIEGSAVTLTLLRPAEVVVGQIQTVSAPVEEIPRKGSPTTYALVTVRGQRQ